MGVLYTDYSPQSPVSGTLRFQQISFVNVDGKVNKNFSLLGVATLFLILREILMAFNSNA